MFSANIPVDSLSHIKFNFYLITEIYIGNTFFVIPHGSPSMTALFSSTRCSRGGKLASHRDCPYSSVTMQIYDKNSSYASVYLFLAVILPVESKALSKRCYNGIITLMSEISVTLQSDLKFLKIFFHFQG